MRILRIKTAIAILVITANGLTNLEDFEVNKKVKKEVHNSTDSMDANVEKVLHLIEAQEVYDSLYTQTISFMKKSEGFRGKPYYCLANVKTIGYGHTIQPTDSLPIPLSESQADSLLKEDFNKRVRWIENDLGIGRLENPSQVIALAHFIFNVGQGNFKNSSIYGNIKENGTLSKDIMDFVHIRTSNGWIKSTNLKKMREYEYALFNKSLV